MDASKRNEDSDSWSMKNNSAESADLIQRNPSIKFCFHCSCLCCPGVFPAARKGLSAPSVIAAHWAWVSRISEVCEMKQVTISRDYIAPSELLKPGYFLVRATNLVWIGLASSRNFTSLCMKHARTMGRCASKMVGMRWPECQREFSQPLIFRVEWLYGMRFVVLW